MRQLRSFILVLLILNILACSNSNNKPENNIAVVNDQEAVQDQIEPVKQQEPNQLNNSHETSNKQIPPGKETDSISIKTKSDSLYGEIAINKEMIALSRKKIINYQDELNFFVSQQNKLIADQAMNEDLDRVNKNIETIQVYSDEEENKISLAKENIIRLERELKILRASKGQSSNTIIPDIKGKNIDSELVRDEEMNPDPALATMDTLALEHELNNLLVLKSRLNKRILIIKTRLDSLRSPHDLNADNEKLPSKKVPVEKKKYEDVDQHSASQLQDLASKTISQKKNLSAEQVTTAKEQNSSDTTIQSNRGFAKFIGIFFLIILVLISSLYLLGRSSSGKKQNG